MGLAVVFGGKRMRLSINEHLTSLSSYLATICLLIDRGSRYKELTEFVQDVVLRRISGKSSLES